MRPAHKRPYRDLIMYCDRNSSSARAIATLIGCRRWFEESSPGRKTAPVVPVVVNWGASNVPNWISPEKWPWPNGRRFHYLNASPLVAAAINKIETFKKLAKADVPTLEWTTDPKIAHSWCAEGERTVAGLARTKLSGKSGEGIELFYNATEYGVEGDVFPDAPLYTLYYPKTHEFRVHVFRGQVIDFVEKKLRAELVGQENVNRIVRSHDNGWVFAHDGIALSADDRGTVGDACVRAVSALGLDFGAVDVLVRLRKKEPRKMKDFKVCEINTGPGLENTATLRAYADAILSTYKELKGK